MTMIQGKMVKSSLRSSLLSSSAEGTYGSSSSSTFRGDVSSACSEAMPGDTILISEVDISQGPLLYDSCRDFVVHWSPVKQNTSADEGLEPPSNKLVGRGHRAFKPRVVSFIDLRTWRHSAGKLLLSPDLDAEKLRNIAAAIRTGRRSVTSCVLRTSTLLMSTE